MADEQSLAASFETSATNINWLDNVAIQIKVRNVTDNTGQFSIEVSNDKDVWQAVDLDPVIPVLADADADIFVNMSQLAWAWVRVKFVAAGGTPDGDVTITLTAKEL